MSELLSISYLQYHGAYETAFLSPVRAKLTRAIMSAFRESWLV